MRRTLARTLSVRVQPWWLLRWLWPRGLRWEAWAMSDIEAYSDDTGKRYPNWDALVAAETNGYVVVSTSTRPGTVPAVNGPYPDKATARRKQIALRRKWQRDEAPHTVRTYVRLLWP